MSIDRHSEIFTCSECGAVLGQEEIDFDYCGCCGGDGLGDEDDDGDRVDWPADDGEGTPNG